MFCSVGHVPRSEPSTALLGCKPLELRGLCSLSLGERAQTVGCWCAVPSQESFPPPAAGPLLEILLECQAAHLRKAGGHPVLRSPVALCFLESKRPCCRGHLDEMSGQVWDAGGIEGFLRTPLSTGLVNRARAQARQNETKKECKLFSSFELPL